MKYSLSVRSDGESIAEFEAGKGAHRIGSDPSCGIRLEHPEMSPVAASLEVSGEVVFLRNHSEFPIYLGPAPLAPGEVAEWRPGNDVQLTRSLAMSLSSSVEVAAPAESTAEGADRSQSLMQIAVIAVCAVLAFWILATEEDPTTRESDAVISFDDLIAQYEQAGGTDLSKLRHQQRMDLNYLTEARIFEKRWGKQRLEEARRGYELILTSAVSTDDENSLAALTRKFAASRIDVLK